MRKCRTIIYFLIFILSCKFQDKKEQLTIEPEVTQLRFLTLNEKLSLNPELKNALVYYSSPKDSLKRKALLFLIENMEYKQSISPNIAEELKEIFETVYKIGLSDTFDRRKKYLPADIVDKIQRKYNPAYSFDVNTIKSSLLIENIEYAFKAWSLPWSKHISFKEFCEYILPYKIHNEPLSGWRKYLFEAQRPFTDSLIQKGIKDPVTVCKLLNQKLFNMFVFYEGMNPPYIFLEDQFQFPVGDCKERYFLYTALARSIGLPTAIDFTPQYPRHPGNHSWTVLTNDGRGKILAFNGGDKWAENPFKGLKIYRNTYQNYNKRQEKGLQGLFANPNYIDVSVEYPFERRDIEISLLYSIDNSKVYMHTYGIGKDLVPMCEGTVINGNKIIFKDLLITEDGLVLPTILENGNIKPIQNPIIIKSWTKDLGQYSPYKVLKKVRLLKKYPSNWEMAQLAQNIAGSKIQGANKPNFSDAKTLFTYKEIPDRYTEYEIKDTVAFKYYRYLANGKEPLNFAEFRFYLKDTKTSTYLLTKSNLYSTSSINSESLALINDENIRTNISATPSSWFGIENKNNKACLGKIGIVPRNNWNEIEKGHEYELFYFDIEWFSLGKKVADNLYIEFDHVPVNAVCILKDLTDGKQERVFTYENEYQLFW